MGFTGPPGAASTKATHDGITSGGASASRPYRSSPVVLEPALRHAPRINRGTGPAMPATRSPEGGTRPQYRPAGGGQAPAEENRGPAMT